jgi:hypothetical protein
MNVYAKRKQAKTDGKELYKTDEKDRRELRAERICDIIIAEAMRNDNNKRIPS